MMNVKELALNWIENADVSPVPEISIETARQYLSWMNPETLPEGITPENFADAWNDVIRTDSEQWKQYLADVYHCSETWGQKMTEDETRTSLIEWEKEKDDDDYSPSPHLFRECCEYWNELCDAYPN